MAAIFNVANFEKGRKAKGGKPQEVPLRTMWTSKPDVHVKCMCTAFSPSCEDLAVGVHDGSIAIFNARNGRIKSKLGGADADRGMAMCISWHPKAEKTALRVALSDGKIERWDVKRSSSTATNINEGGQTLALDYSYDGQYYAGGGVDARNEDMSGPVVRLYDDGTSKQLRALSGDATSLGHSNRISCIRFNQSRSAKDTLATGSMDGTVKLWSVGDKRPITSFPADQAAYFEVAGSSIDFDGFYMLIGSARPHKHLIIYDLRTRKAVSEVAWRATPTAQSQSAAGRKWALASLAHIRKANILAASFADAGKIFAGGSMSVSGAPGGEIKVFTPNEARPVDDAYPVDGEQPTERASGNLRQLYTPVASWQCPSGVMAMHVSTKPVICAGDEIGEGSAKERAHHDTKVCAVAASNGNVYAVEVPSELPRHPEPLI